MTHDRFDLICLTSHCLCAHCDINAETIYCAALIPDIVVGVWCNFSTHFKIRHIFSISMHPEWIWQTFHLIQPSFIQAKVCSFDTQTITSPDGQINCGIYVCSEGLICAPEAVWLINIPVFSNKRPPTKDTFTAECRLACFVFFQILFFTYSQSSCAQYSVWWTYQELSHTVEWFLISFIWTQSPAGLSNLEQLVARWTQLTSLLDRK